MDQLFVSGGGLLSLAELSSEAASGLLMDVVGFIFVCTLIISPPPALTHCGLILENLPRPRSYVGTSLLHELEMKTHFNRLYLTILPVLFLLYELVVFDRLVTAAICLSLYAQIQSIIAFRHYYNVTRGRTRFASEFSKEELVLINAAYVSPCFVTRPSYSNVVLLNDRFFINERRFGYSIERVADLTFAAVESIITVQGIDFLKIVAENGKTGSSYTFRIHSNDISKLREFVTVQIKCKSIIDRFIERFTAYIDGNPKFIMRDTASLDACFACYAKQPDVIIKKGCIGDSCTECACRPNWCSSCLARIFAAAQPAERFSQWMDGTAACPTCRAVFCANDVFFIIDRDDL